jgi:predicted RNase H-like HicB family nuclease
MRHAKFELLEDDGSVYGWVPVLPGVWANSETIEGCRRELEEIASEWILLAFAEDDALPVIDGVELVIEHQYMKRDGVRLALPGADEEVISGAGLARILREAQIPEDEWKKL